MTNLLRKLRTDFHLERETPCCSAQANHDLERSIIQVGCIYPLVADQNLVVIDGHRRLRVLRRHRISDFMCIFLDCDSPEQRRLYREMLNSFRRSCNGLG